MQFTFSYLNHEIRKPQFIWLTVKLGQYLLTSLDLYSFLIFYRKLKQTMHEFCTRCGQQAVLLCVSPGKDNPSFKVFGASPLDLVVCGMFTRIQISVSFYQTK